MSHIKFLKLPSYCVSKPFHKTDQNDTRRSLLELVGSPRHLLRFFSTKLHCRQEAFTANSQFSWSQQPLLTVSDFMHVKYTFTGRPKSRGRDADLSSVICLARWHLGPSSHLSVFFSGASNKINRRCLGMLPSSQNTKELDSYYPAIGFRLSASSRVLYCL